MTMKKISTLIATLLFTLVVFSQDCNIGNSDPSNGNFVDGNFLPDYLLGVNFTLSEVGVLHSLNFLGNGSGTNVKMAIYNDISGVPNNLVAQTEASTVMTGINSFPVSPTQLEAGDYWIMAVYDTNGNGNNHSSVNYSDESSLVYYNDLPFNNSIPNNASNFMSYTGQDLLYFAEISCGALSVSDYQLSSISIYPNPASDHINVANLQENVKFEIYEVSGKKVMEKELSELNNGIDISHLSSGMYFISGGNCTSKFVKN